MPAPKNLIFLLSDNHHRAASGAYGNGQAHTPNLDRLAATGVTFDNAYSASPLCCPARASLACGRFPHQTGYWDNAITYDGATTSWMRRLRDQGHEVVSVGKLHFRATEDDNGFSREILPMHILGGKGGTHMLLRGHDAEQVNHGQFELYMERSGEGTAPYQAFDRKITDAACAWLEEEGTKQDKPFVLFVSWPSPHPPFSVPAEFYDLIDEAGIELPAYFAPGERSEHPSLQHLRHIMGTGEITDKDALRTIMRGYLGLVAHLDNEIGKVLAKLEALGLMEDSRIIYTSDHGELAGEHGLFGKSCLLEGSIGVPLIVSGNDVPQGRRATQLVSHVDLFPTIVEAVGGKLADEDADLPGISLWPAVAGEEDLSRPVFAEYHAVGSKSGGFMLREGRMKLIYHVGMPAQLFDLEADPHEGHDLVASGEGLDEAARLERLLRTICDPEAVDRRAKADQRAKIEFWGGREAVESEGLLVYTPPPGEAPEPAPRGGHA